MARGWQGGLPFRLASLALICSSFAGCQRFDPEPASLGLTRFRQAGAEGVRLNESLVFHFTEELDWSSVTRGSVRIVDAEGAEAQGRFDVQQNQLLFHPRLPTRADLSDAGLLPGAEYTVELAGFPLPDGLRSRTGRPLRYTWRSRFCTPDADAPNLFEDPSMAWSLPLELVTDEVVPGEELRLACGEPLDPRSLFDADFTLNRVQRDSTGEAVPLVVRLIENSPSGAVISLRAVLSLEERTQAALQPGLNYGLEIDSVALRLRDLGGNPARPIWQTGSIYLPEVPIYVRAPDPYRARPQYIVLDFMDTQLRSPAGVEGADGTASWSRDGVATVRLPRAVGDGSDGPVELGSEVADRAIFATSLRQAPEAETAVLGERPVVLRSQGRMELAGTLRRELEGRPWNLDREQLHERWGERHEDFSAHQSLDDWLETLEDSDVPWTVLLAGGDLVLSGDIAVNGPLLLIAGGRIRITGSVSSSEDVFKVGDGGGGVIRPNLRVLELPLEPLVRNPLVVPLTFSVLSAPIRPPDGVEAWRPASVEGRAGAGQFRISYFGQREVGGRRLELSGPVTDPALLTDAEAVIVRLDLTVEPGPVWDPPRVDRIALEWSEAH